MVVEKPKNREKVAANFASQNKTEARDTVNGLFASDGVGDVIGGFIEENAKKYSYRHIYEKVTAKNIRLTEDVYLEKNVT